MDWSMTQAAAAYIDAVDATLKRWEPRHAPPTDSKVEISGGIFAKGEL